MQQLTNKRKTDLKCVAHPRFCGRRPTFNGQPPLPYFFTAVPHTTGNDARIDNSPSAYVYLFVFMRTLQRGGLDQ